MAEIVSTPHCPTCNRNFWHYRGDFPPRPYCSWACYDARRRKVPKPQYEKAADVLEAFRDHRVSAHQCADVTTWFDCEVCDRFEERYAVSMYL